MNSNRPTYFIILILLSCFIAEAQQLEWRADERIVFDNREGDNTYTDTKTFLQSQLAAEVGASFDDGTHSIMAGGVWTQPFTDNFKEGRLAPTIYYRYEGSRLKGSFGLLPRAQLMRKVPSYVWSDSMVYSDANIRGGLIQYSGDKGFFEAFLDWRGLQARDRREAFTVVGQGEWNVASPMLIGGTVMMNHYARSYHDENNEHVCEDFIVNPIVGVDLRSISSLDSLAIRTGCVIGMTRDRGLDKWFSVAGFWLDVAAQWRWLGVKNTLYAGGRLFPYYSNHGSAFNEGEPYYASKYYNRTTVSADLVRNKIMCLRASVDLNAAEHSFTWYQRITLRVAFDSRLWRKHGKIGGKPYLPNFY